MFMAQQIKSNQRISDEPFGNNKQTKKIIFFIIFILKLSTTDRTHKLIHIRLKTADSIKLRECPEKLRDHRNQRKDNKDSNEGTVHKRTEIYRRVNPVSIKTGFYTFPKIIPNKIAGY